MKKGILQLFVSGAMIFMLASCGGGKYADVIEVNDKFVSATEKYISAMEKAESGMTVAEAVNDYAEAIEKIAPQMKKMAEKYPELKDRSKIPEELKESSARVEGMEGKMAGIMMKSVSYMRDPAVAEAQKRLQEAMLIMM